MPGSTKRLGSEPLEPLILSIQGHRVILDADLARIYGVTTRVLNQGVRRNSHRFPGDFAFQLTATEAAGLKAQLIDPKTDTGNRSQIVTGSQKHRDPRFRPWAFTEHGALMAANRAILQRLAEIDKTLLQHDAALRDIYRKLLPLLQPPLDPPKRSIGFRKDQV